MLKKCLTLMVMVTSLATGLMTLAAPKTNSFRHATFEECVQWRMETYNMDYNTAADICCPKYFTHC